MPTRLVGIAFFVLLATLQPIHAQSVDSSRLTLQVDATQFFQNNEYFGQRQEGYTLPGFRLTPRVQWRLNHKILLEVGADWIHFWGATSYPTLGSLDIMLPYSDTSSSLHIRPHMRVHLQLIPAVHLLMGSLSSNQGHLLPLPLYNPERRYAAEAETGVQLLADLKHLKADLWVNWCDFIWSRSPYQERFVAGLSLRGHFALNHDAKWWLRPSAHILGQHTGGQTLAYSTKVKNTFNFAAGLELGHSPAPHWTVVLRCHAMAFSQKGNDAIPFTKGWGLYPEAETSWSDGRGGLSLGYWSGSDFVPLLGSPLFSNVSVRDDLAPGSPRYFDHTHLLTFTLRHAWDTFGDTCRLTLVGRLYQYLGSNADPTAFSFGIFIDMCPSLTLLR